LWPQGKFLGTQIHHALFTLAPPVLTITIAVIETAELISLMPMASLTQHALPAQIVARLAAIGLAVVAAHTHVEHRPTPNT